MSNINSDSPSQVKTNTERYIRRLDYVADCTNGNRFTMVPDKLMTAWLDGRMPEPKFKLICLMLHHAKTFQIWRSTLEKTVSNNSLKKYLPQIIDEGYVEVESIRTGRGGAIKNVYHVRALEYWEVYRESASPNPPPIEGSPVSPNPPPLQPSPLQPSPVEDITKTTDNQTKENQTNSNLGEKNLPPKLSQAKPLFKKITKSSLIGQYQNLFEYCSREQGDAAITLCLRGGVEGRTIERTINHFSLQLDKLIKNPTQGHAMSLLKSSRAFVD